MNEQFSLCLIGLDVLEQAFLKFLSCVFELISKCEVFVFYVCHFSINCSAGII